MITILCCIAMWDYSYDCGIHFAYDSNIFSYSPEYIDEFMDRIRPYRFPFETYDDLFTTADMALLIRNRFIKERTTTLNIGVHVRHYAINQTKDFQRLVVGLRQSFGSWALKGSYRIIPEYVIRYYRDPANTYTDYIPCQVAYHRITGKITLPMIKSLSPAVTYSYSIDDYVESFDIYDAHAHTMGLQTETTLSRTLSLETSYNFKAALLDTSVNVPPENDDPIPDGAFYQQEIGNDLHIRGIASLPLAVTIGYCYAFRKYRSDQPDDRMHFGRQDHQHTISIQAEMKIRTGWFMGSEYSHGVRNATSEVFPEIAAIKNFSKNRVGAGFRFYY